MAETAAIYAAANPAQVQNGRISRVIDEAPTGRLLRCGKEFRLIFGCNAGFG